MSNHLQGMDKISAELFAKLNSVTQRLNKVDSDIKEYMSKNGITFQSLFDMNEKPSELCQLVDEQMMLTNLRSRIEKEIGIVGTYPITFNHL